MIWISPKKWLSPTESLISAISKKKHPFSHSTPLNKLVHLPHISHKKSIWKSSGFHLKKLAQSQKNSKVNKNHINWKFEKKTSRCIASRMVVPNLVLIGRYLDVEMMTQLALQTQNIHRMTESQTYKLLVSSLFRRSEKPRKKVSPQ